MMISTTPEYAESQEIGSIKGKRAISPTGRPASRRFNRLALKARGELLPAS